MELWQLHPKQLEVLKFIEDNDISLIIGSARSGKSFAIMYHLFKECLLNPGLQVACFRSTHAAIINGVFKQTCPELMTHMFPVLSESFIVNKSSSEITFHNNSRIVFRGLDCAARASKILSTQYQIIFIDECNQIDFSYIGILMSRQPQSKTGFKNKMIMACNYSDKSNWTYRFFKEKINPATKKPLIGKINFMKCQTEDNLSIDSKAYFDNLKNNADNRSFLSYGGDDWFDESQLGPLWTQQDIQYNSEDLDYDDIILSYDPATTDKKTSDAHGVAVIGMLDDKFYVLKCYERIDHPTNMANEIISLYHEYSCSSLVVEKNQGGCFIDGLIHNIDDSINIKSVHASQGKMLRAESIITLYRRKLVYHSEQFEDLEDQMLQFRGTGKSPNSLDALVHGLKFLKEHNKLIRASDVW